MPQDDEIEQIDTTAPTSASSSAPSIDVSGSALVGGSALVAGPLYIGGQDVMAAIASAGGGTTINATTQLSLAGVTASGDIQARDLVATRDLHVDGAAVLNGTLTVGGSNVMTASPRR